MLSKGEKIFIITRRLFEKDLRRHFIGEVEDVSGAVLRAKGHAYVFDDGTNKFLLREEDRTRIFSMTDSGILILVLPENIQIEEIRYSIDAQNQRVISDGKAFRLNISEFGPHR